uniref:Venom peptide U15-SYTX-Sth1a n=1 Tax=Scytodes thoracica TaxID=1112478 RepID=A0A0A0V673_SCYTH|nr:venom peptide U15-SYTX-Sth1a [Scytodes thoracica]
MKRTAFLIVCMAVIFPVDMLRIPHAEGEKCDERDGMLLKVGETIYDDIQCKMYVCTKEALEIEDCGYVPPDEGTTCTKIINKGSFPKCCPDIDCMK